MVGKLSRIDNLQCWVTKPTKQGYNDSSPDGLFARERFGLGLASICAGKNTEHAYDFKEKKNTKTQKRTQYTNAKTKTNANKCDSKKVNIKTKTFIFGYFIFFNTL